MKMTNKYLSLLLALIMVFSMMPFATLEASAADIPVVSLKSSSDTVDVGDTITLTITTTPSSKIISFGANIIYDSEYFEVVPDSESYASGLFGDMNANKAGVVKVAFVAGSQTVGDSITDLFTIDFKVLKANGTFDLEILEVYILDGTSQKKVTASVNDAVQPIVIVCNHTYTLVNSSNATCTQDGYKKYVCSKCNVEYTETIATTGHSLVNVSAKAPTCTEKGYEAYEYCTVCDYTTYKGISETGHSIVKVSGKAPTCTEKGYEAYEYCTVCDYTTYKEISETGHSIVKVNGKAPTCTETGYEAYEYCAVCDYTTYKEIFETGHSYESTVTVPSCTKDGYTTYFCTVCNDTYKDDVVPASGHNPGNEIKENFIAPTCMADGSYDTVIYCSVCDVQLSRTKETLPASGHSYKSAVTAPTCEEDGFTTYVCIVCNDTYIGDVVPAIGHNPENVVEENYVAPNCTEDGSVEKVVYCETCDVEISRETEIIPKMNHTPAESVNENYVAPTCTNTGSVEKVVYCAVCDAELSREEETIPMIAHTAGDMVVENKSEATCGAPGSYDEVIYCVDCGLELSRNTETTETLPHSYVSRVTTAPTCTEKGIKAIDCTVCGDSYTEEIPENGHNIVNVNAKEPTCTETGYEAYEYCSVCDYTTYSEITSTGHNFEPTITAPTCEEDGYTTYVCAVCDDTYTDNVVSALGHVSKDSVEENYIAPTCTNTGSVENVVYCEVCDAEVSRETKIISSTGHTPKNSVIENRVSPTCITDGSFDIVVYCSVCDIQISRVEETISQLGHTPEKAVQENYVAPTCTNTGSVEKVVYCAVCDAEVSRETEVISSTGHNYESTVTAPTCEEDGYTTYVCSVCDETYTGDVVSALGHISKDSVEENYIAPTCTDAGSVENVVYCEVCDAEVSRETEVISSTGHSYEPTVTAPTCEEDGYTTYVCAVCDDTYTDGVISALGHNFTDGVCSECNAPDPNYYTFEINTPSTTTIKCKNGIILHAKLNGNPPENSKIVWTINNENFELIQSDDESVIIVSKNKGNSIITATVYDADGNAIAEDTVEMYSDAGFIQKIVGFFRVIFGLTTILEK